MQRQLQICPNFRWCCSISWKSSRCAVPIWNFSLTLKVFSTLSDTCTLTQCVLFCLLFFFFCKLFINAILLLLFLIGSSEQTWFNFRKFFALFINVYATCNVFQMRSNKESVRFESVGCVGKSSSPLVVFLFYSFFLLFDKSNWVKTCCIFQWLTQYFIRKIKDIQTENGSWKQCLISINDYWLLTCTSRWYYQ